MTRRRLALLLAVVLLLLAAFPLAAAADMGPKPKVTLTLKGLDGRECFATLLSEREGYGPWSVIRTASDRDMLVGNRPDVFEKFIAYDDPDDFFFLGHYQDASDGSYEWGYYPPSPFKVLLYFPESDVFLSGPVCERYAFISNFTVTVNGGALTVSESGSPSGDPLPALIDDALTVEPERHIHLRNIPSFLARLVLTVLIELGVAWLFRFRGKKLWLLFLTTNALTQTALNLILYNVLYLSGSLAFQIRYPTLEIFVFLVEALTYAVAVPRLSSQQPKPSALPSDTPQPSADAEASAPATPQPSMDIVTPRPPRRLTILLYALAANAASFVLGVLLWKIIPAIF